MRWGLNGPACPAGLDQEVQTWRLFAKTHDKRFVSGSRNKSNPCDSQRRPPRGSSWLKRKDKRQHNWGSSARQPGSNINRGSTLWRSFVCALCFSLSVVSFYLLSAWLCFTRWLLTWSHSGEKLWIPHRCPVAALDPGTNAEFNLTQHPDH